VNADNPQELAPHPHPQTVEEIVAESVGAHTTALTTLPAPTRRPE
jgi:hypothetical protein